MLVDELKLVFDEFNDLDKKLNLAKNKYHSLKNDIMEVCKNKLKEFGVDISLWEYDLLYMKEWNPLISIDGYRDTNNNRTFIKLDGKWCWYGGWVGLDRLYKHEVIDGLDSPFDVDALEQACKELEDELGITVCIKEYKSVSNVEYPENIDDLKVMFPDCEILGEGRIWYVGWDIPDIWAILKDKDGGIHIFYGTNSHEEGYDVHLKPGDNYKQFLDYIDENNIKADVPNDIRTLLSSS